MRIILWHYLFVGLVMGSLLLAYGCGDMAKPVRFRLVTDSVSWVSSNEAVYLVVTDKNWSNYYSTRPLGSDFTNNIYLVASRGVKPNPGYAIKILEVKQFSNTITIKVEVKDPDPKKMYAQVLVHPIAVAQVAKADLGPPNLLNFIFVGQKGSQLAIVEARI